MVEVDRNKVVITPSREYARVGDDLDLRCSLNHVNTGSLSFSWYKDSEELGKNVDNFGDILRYSWVFLGCESDT